MGKVIAATAMYFAIVFGAGFVLGPMRVLWLEPRVAARLAVAIELPLLLLAMVIAARWVPRRAGIEGPAALAAMGAGALLLVLLADFAIGIGLRGLSFDEQVRQFRTPAGMLYAGSLGAFAAMPLLVNPARYGGR